MPVHPLKPQWEIDKKCVTCGAHSDHRHECPDCVRKRNNEQVRRWNRNNPGKMKAKSSAIRARKLGLTEHFSAKEWSDLCRMYGNVCLRCREKKPLVPDHIIPLGQEDSTNTIENIQPLCSSCNSVKNNKRADYRIGAPVLDFTMTNVVDQLMRAPYGILHRFLRVD